MERSGVRRCAARLCALVSVSRTHSPTNSATALKGQVWLVLLLFRKAGFIFVKTRDRKVSFTFTSDHAHAAPTETDTYAAHADPVLAALRHVARLSILRPAAPVSEQDKGALRRWCHRRPSMTVPEFKANASSWTTCPNRYWGASSCSALAWISMNTLLFSHDSVHQQISNSPANRQIYILNIKVR